MRKREETLLGIARMSEDQARAYLEDIRWNGSPVCPHCGEPKRIGTLKNVRDKKGEVRKGLYKCYDCRKQFTVTTGTVMHGTHFSIQQWIVAFHLMAACKKGVAALELQRVLGIGSYKCALHLSHRIREAMKFDPLLGLMKGVVEVDETYIGGKTKGAANSGRSSTDKTPVVAVIERGGSAYSLPVDKVTARNLKTAVWSVTHPDAAVHTDEFPSYKGIGKLFRGGHHTVNHSKGEYSSGEVTSNSAESYFAILKRGVNGTFHHVSRKHLHRYCNEFAFRWTWRKTSDGERASAIMSRIGGRRLTYKAMKSSE